MTEIGYASNGLNAFNLLELNSKDQRAPALRNICFHGIHQRIRMRLTLTHLDDVHNLSV
jgi:hypothetical protein